MNDSDAVLAANLEFYRAFTTRDIDAMEALWAQRAPVACVHPGWPPLADRAAVMESWRGILSSGDSPRIACYDERVFLYGDTALVVCEEELDGETAGRLAELRQVVDAMLAVEQQAKRDRFRNYRRVN